MWYVCMYGEQGYRSLTAGKEVSDIVVVCTQQGGSCNHLTCDATFFFFFLSFYFDILLPAGPDRRRSFLMLSA